MIVALLYWMNGDLGKDLGMQVKVLTSCMWSCFMHYT